MNFAKGQEFTNKNGVKIKILSVDKQHDYILIQIGNDKKDVTFHGLEAIISKNGYEKDSVKCTLDKAIRTLDRTVVHIVTYKDIDGKTQKETIKGTVEEFNRRVNELKKHDCKIIKQQAFANW